MKICYKKWYVIDSQTRTGIYKQSDTIQIETETVKSSLCNYSDAFILVTWNITVNADDNTDAPFKNCAPFSTWKTVINDVFFNEANHIYIAMPMYNLIHQDVGGSLKEMKFLPIMLIWLLIVLNLLNTKQLLYEKQQMLLLTQIAL